MEYGYIKVPTNLFYLMDANCTKVLITLIQMSEFYGNYGWFYRTMNNLEDSTHLSANIIRATLDALYREGLIDVDCVGISKGKHPNHYKVNFEKFQEYEKYSLDEIISGGARMIETTKYKTGHFTPSYIRQSTGQQTGQKVSTNITNIDNITNINNIDNLPIDIPTIVLKEENKKEEITEVIDIPVKEKETYKEKESQTPGTPNPERKVRFGKDFDFASAYQIPGVEGRLECQYYYVMNELPTYESNRRFNEDSLRWEEDQDISTLTNCMLYWYDGGREKLAEMVQGLPPNVTKDVIAYLVLYCKDYDTSGYNSPRYEVVYAK